MGQPYFQNSSMRYAAEIMSKCTSDTQWTEQRTALFHKSTGKLVGILPVSSPYAGVVQLEKQFDLEARVIDVTVNFEENNRHTDWPSADIDADDASRDANS